MLPPNIGWATKEWSDLVNHALDLVQRDGVIAPVVEARSAGRLVPGHLLRHFQLAAVLQVRGDAGGAEAVTQNLGLDVGGDDVRQVLRDRSLLLTPPTRLLQFQCH